MLPGVPLTIFAAGIFIIGSNQYLFKHTYQLRTQFTLWPACRRARFRCGTVRGIELPHDPNGKVM